MTVLKTKVDKVAASSSQRLLEELPREKLAWMLQRMCEIRYFEEKAEDLYVRGLVHGTMHLSIGQEAGSVGSIATLRPEDLIIHHHRGHGHTIAKGANLTTMFAEFLGREAGYCRGRGGSMHIADIPGGNLGATGVVGGGIPTAVGIALALQMHRSEQDPAVLLWRRGLERRRVPRIVEYGLHLEAAGGVHLRQQPVRHVDARIQGQ